MTTTRRHTRHVTSRSRAVNRSDPRPSGLGTEDGLFVDGPLLQPLLPVMHIVSPVADGWVCVRPAHAGQPCTEQLPASPQPA